jgi:hypothetical protein
LVDVVPASARLSEDPLTITRGLRRLRQQEGPGNKYGRLLLRYCGAPPALAAWARELGQYHSRSSDLPLWMRREQLQRWDCPPVSEASRVAIWVHLALASVAHREGDAAQRARRLSLARLLVRQAELAAQVELSLFEARISSDAGERETCARSLSEAETLLRGLAGEELACYQARILDQRAFSASRGWREDSARLSAALALYERIPAESPVPFVRFRREHGRAWCLWRMGRSAEATQVARWASQHAGDGGLVRLRAMSLELRGHIAGAASPEGIALFQRARAMFERLGDSFSET